MPRARGDCLYYKVCPLVLLLMPRARGRSAIYDIAVDRIPIDASRAWGLFWIIEKRKDAEFDNPPCTVIRPVDASAWVKSESVRNLPIQLAP